jgi:hypothetical protein
LPGLNVSLSTTEYRERTTPKAFPRTFGVFFDLEQPNSTQNQAMGHVTREKTGKYLPKTITGTGTPGFFL